MREGWVFALRLVPVFSVSNRLYCTVNGCKLLVLLSPFRTGSVFMGGFNVSLDDSLLFSYMITLFLHSVFLWMSTFLLYRSVFSFMYVCVFGSVCVWERVYVHACAHIFMLCSFSVSSLQVKGHISCRGGWGRAGTGGEGGGTIVVALSQVCGYI